MAPTTVAPVAGVSKDPNGAAVRPGVVTVSVTGSDIDVKLATGDATVITALSDVLAPITLAGLVIATVNRPVPVPEPPVICAHG